MKLVDGVRAAGIGVAGAGVYIGPGGVAEVQLDWHLDRVRTGEEPSPWPGPKRIGFVRWKPGPGGAELKPVPVVRCRVVQTWEAPEAPYGRASEL